MTELILQYNDNPGYKAWVEFNYNLTPQNVYSNINLQLLQEYLREEFKVLVWVRPCDVEFNELFYPKVTTNKSIRHSFKPKSTYYEAMIYGITKALTMLSDDDVVEAYEWKNF